MMVPGIPELFIFIPMGTGRIHRLIVVPVGIHIQRHNECVWASSALFFEAFLSASQSTLGIPETIPVLIEVAVSFCEHLPQECISLFRCSLLLATATDPKQNDAREPMIFLDTRVKMCISSTVQEWVFAWKIRFHGCELEI